MVLLKMESVAGPRYCRKQCCVPCSIEPGAADAGDPRGAKEDARLSPCATLQPLKSNQEPRGLREPKKKYELTETLGD